MFRSLVFCISITISIPACITMIIRGGDEVPIDEIPFQVSISRNGSFKCGGSIITKSFILTAAHCTEKDPEPSHYTIRTGSDVTKQGGQLHNVTRIIPHENYYRSRRSLHNDICLLQIDPPVSFDSKQQPVDLATDAGSLPAWSTVSVSGFGAPADNERSTERLRIVDLPIIDWNRCYNRAYPRSVTKDHICAGNKDNSRNSCKGDSGGPLFTHSQIQIGIVSSGPCSTLGPGLYTNVSFFMKWIIEKLAEAGEEATFRSCTPVVSVFKNRYKDMFGSDTVST